MLSALVVGSVTPILILFWGQLVPMLVAIFSVARHGRGREPWYGALAASGTLIFVDLTVDVLQSVNEIIFPWTVFVLAWTAGYGLHTMERRAKESMQRAIEAEVGSAKRTMAAQSGTHAHRAGVA
jgi:undecaprenyl pyrophosphate phosphatase UppP